MIDIRKREIWTGRWRWNAETARFSNPVHSHAWKSRTHDIIVRDNHMLMLDHHVYPDGGARTWRWDGDFDGRPRPITWDDDGSVMATIAFSFLEELTGGDIFVSADGKFRGAEYFMLGQDNYKVWGSSTTDGKQYPYFEEWGRIG
jgi:hypothetical protein